MLKKLISLSFIFFFSTTTSLASFTDINENTAFFDEINYLINANKINDDSLYFFPNKEISREDLYKMIIEYAQIKENDAENIELHFLDKNKMGKYTPYIKTAVKENLIQNTFSNFGIKTPLTKYETLNTLFNIFGIAQNQLDSIEDFNFSDINENGIYNKTAQLSYKIGVREDENTKFLQNKTVTKAELYHYLYLIDEYQNFNTITLETNNKSQKSTELDDIINTYDLINKNYYYQENIDKDLMISEAINAMIETLNDDYTEYQNQEEAENFMQSIENNYEGIGAILEETENGYIKIVSTFENSPAKKAGLKTNDIIIKVNQTDIKDLGLNNTTTLIKGKAGTTVNLEIKRENQTLKIEVERQKINLYEVKAEKLYTNGKEILYLQIPLFAANTFSDLKSKIDENFSENTKGIIIDVRNNPGGLLDQAIKIIELFTEEGDISVTTKNSKGKEINYKNSKTGKLNGTKTKILINQGSASASEILAGSLKDNENYTIIGEQSYGKGSVQELHIFENGAMLKFTSSIWLTPNKHSIDKNGIAPDIQISDNPDTEKDEVLKKALTDF